MPDTAALHLPIPPAKLPPGRAGDFDFLSGDWRIAHQRLPYGSTEWDLFEGEATCWSILHGVCSVEELRIPARNFAGMGLRLLDQKSAVWSDHWVNAASGVITLPGAAGGFVDGVGYFLSDYLDGDVTLRVLGIWDQITPESCRWRQATTRGNAVTWSANWIMHWRRA
jgi:hypothetical protein